MCIIVFIVTAAILSVAGWLLFLFVSGWAAEAGWLAVAVAMILAPLLAVFVHEAGHLLAGVAAGLSPALMIVGPVGFSWRRGRPWPRVRLNDFIPGGFTFCVPRANGPVRPRMILMTAGGPLASLLLVAAAAFAFLAVEGHPGQAAGFAGLVSGGLFLMTAVPYSRGGMMSDGAKIRTLMKNGRRARSAEAALRLLGAARCGTRPAQWPPELIEEALDVETGTPERASALHLAYWSALDAGDMDRARYLISSLLSEVRKMSEAIAAPASWEAAAFHLFVCGEPAAARALIGGRRPAVFQDEYLEPLIYAGLAAAEGDREGTARYARQARVALPRALFPAVANIHACWLESMEGTPRAADAARDPAH